MSLYSQEYILLLDSNLSFKPANFKLSPKDLFNINIFRNHLVNQDYELTDRCRRKTHWILIGQFESKYKSYQDFKQQWDADSKLFNRIHDKYLEEKHKVLIIKKTFLWFINRRKE